jgi:hypothetical protein
MSGEAGHVLVAALEAIAEQLPLYEGCAAALNGLGEHVVAAHFTEVLVASQRLLAAAHERLGDVLADQLNPPPPPT